MPKTKSEVSCVLPRPRKWRKVCCLPNTNRFGPLNGCVSPDDVIQMTVDEYETIRLIDLEGMNQEDCAQSYECGAHYSAGHLQRSAAQIGVVVGRGPGCCLLKAATIICATGRATAVGREVVRKNVCSSWRSGRKISCRKRCGKNDVG